jgi:hypothetical protein
MLSFKTTKDSKGNIIVDDDTAFYNTSDKYYKYGTGTKIGISDAGQIIIKNTTTSMSLGLTLNKLMLGLTAFNAALAAAGASGVLSPLVAPATALQLVVSEVQTDLTTLLEP